MDNPKIPIELLKAKRQSLLQDVDDLEKELNDAKRIVGISSRVSKQRKTDFENRWRKDQQHLALYESFSGIHVNSISLKTVPLEVDGHFKLWYKYTVNAAIDSLVFNVKYTTNIAHMNSENKVEPIIQKLEIKMAKVCNQTECSECLEYYASNPNHMDAAFLCLKQYNSLNIKRRNMLKYFLPRYIDYIEISLAPKTGHFQINFFGKYSKVIFFKMWLGVVFDGCSMKNSFSVQYETADEQLNAEVQELYPLCCKEMKDIEDVKKIEIFEKIIVAVADADTRQMNL